MSSAGVAVQDLGTPNKERDVVTEAARFRHIAGEFTERVRAVPAGAWDNPAPCEGWVARDVVRHLVEWVPAFFDTYAGVDLPTSTTVDTDPLGAWLTLRDAMQAMFDDPAVASRNLELHGARYTIAEAVDRFVTPDVLVHTWDLARATGGDEWLDAEEVHKFVDGMEELDDLLRNSGQYGPRVPVPDDADEQTRLIAFLGRQP